MTKVLVKELKRMSRTIEIGCSWADGCGHGEGTIEVDSFDAFATELEKFFEDMCGMSGVESFGVYCDDEEYEWDNYDLPRNRDLTDVWSSVEKDLEIFFNAVTEDKGE